MRAQEVCGSIPQLFRNSGGHYEGNLVPYFRILWNEAANLNNPYHNFRHICHVVWQCHEACLFYGQQAAKLSMAHQHSQLSMRKRRNLLLGAFFHDFNHTGKRGPDSMNIAVAMRAIEKHLQPEDRPYLSDINHLVAMTEYPYTVPPSELDLSCLILRDADVSQAFNPAWIQQVIFGLAAEWGMTPLEVLKMQAPFCEKLQFHTTWAQRLYPPEVVQAKVTEAEDLLELLTGEPVTLT